MMQFFSKIGKSFLGFFFSYFLFVPHDQNNIYYKMALEIKKKKCDIYLEGLHFIITMIFFKGLTSMDWNAFLRNKSKII